MALPLKKSASQGPKIGNNCIRKLRTPTSSPLVLKRSFKSIFRCFGDLYRTTFYISCLQTTIPLNGNVCADQDGKVVEEVGEEGCVVHQLM